MRTCGNRAIRARTSKLIFSAVTSACVHRGMPFTRQGSQVQSLHRPPLTSEWGQTGDKSSLPPLPPRSVTENEPPAPQSVRSAPGDQRADLARRAGSVQCRAELDATRAAGRSALTHHRGAAPATARGLAARGDRSQLLDVLLLEGWAARLGRDQPQRPSPARPHGPAAQRIGMVFQCRATEEANTLMTKQCRHLELLRREDGKYWDCGGCGERFTLVPFSDEPSPARADQWTPEEMAAHMDRAQQNMCQGCFRPVSHCVCNAVNRSGDS